MVPLKQKIKKKSFMVMRKIEETSFSYSCLRQKNRRKKRECKKKELQRIKKRRLRWYEIGI